MATNPQQQRIDELTETVNILSGQVAALMAYIAAVTPQLDPGRKLSVQGAAQKTAPNGFVSKTPPARAASEGVDRILSLAQKLQTPQQP